MSLQQGQETRLARYSLPDITPQWFPSSMHGPAVVFRLEVIRASFAPVWARPIGGRAIWKTRLMLYFITRHADGCCGPRSNGIARGVQQSAACHFRETWALHRKPTVLHERPVGVFAQMRVFSLRYFEELALAPVLAARRAA
jgi:hypothetical protein